MYEDILKKYNYSPTRLSSPGQAPQQSTNDRLKELDDIIAGIDTTEQKAVPVEQKQGTVEGLATGVYKGAASTVANIGSLGQKALEKITGIKSTPTLNESLGNTLEAKTTAEKIGKGAEQVGEFFVPGMAGLKVEKGANLLSKVGASALEAAGVTSAQGGTGKDIGVAGVIGAVSPTLGLLSRFIKPAKTAEQAVGQIAQGTTKEVPIFKRALELVNTKGVKTFEDLKTKFDDVIPDLAGKVDNELAKDSSLYSLTQLASKAKNKTGQEITTDYVGRSLNQLSELYGKIGDDVAKSDIENIIIKANKEGLTRQEVNNISRIYGVEFGQKAFGKTGEALTSVNAQNFENTRKGLKTVARQGLGGKEAQILDAKLSDVFDAKLLVEKNMEAVNKLKQKIDERGVLEKLGNTGAKLINTLSGGTLRGIVSGVLGSNVGNKQLNALGVEKALQKNLSLLEKALNAKTEASLIDNLKGISNKLIKIGVIKGVNQGVKQFGD